MINKKNGYLISIPVIECNEGTFGYDCVNNCSGHCFNTSSCNKENGHCDKGCNPGYTKSDCSKGKFIKTLLTFCFEVIEFFFFWFDCTKLMHTLMSHT